MSGERDDVEGEATLTVKNIPRAAYERWQATAAQHGISLSAWVRLILSANTKRGRAATLERIR
jgi:plasmid stability protein